MIRNERRSCALCRRCDLVTLFALMCIVPLIYMILVSFADTTTMYIQWEDIDLFDFSNYIYLFENREFGRPILNSLIVVVISVIVVDLVSCTMAYGFEKKPMPGKRAAFQPGAGDDDDTHAGRVHLALRDDAQVGHCSTPISRWSYRWWAPSASS